MYSNAEDNIDDFDRRDADDEACDDPTQKPCKKMDITAIDRSEWGTSDYVLMKGVHWEDIPKRVSYNLVPHSIPPNTKWCCALKIMRGDSPSNSCAGTSRKPSTSTSDMFG